MFTSLDSFCKLCNLLFLVSLLFLQAFLFFFFYYHKLFDFFNASFFIFFTRMFCNCAIVQFQWVALLLPATISWSDLLLYTQLMHGDFFEQFTVLCVPMLCGLYVFSNFYNFLLPCSLQFYSLFFVVYVSIKCVHSRFFLASFCI